MLEVVASTVAPPDGHNANTHHDRFVAPVTSSQPKLLQCRSFDTYNFPRCHSAGQYHLPLAQLGRPTNPRLVPERRRFSPVRRLLVRIRELEQRFLRPRSSEELE